MGIVLVGCHAWRIAVKYIQVVVTIGEKDKLINGRRCRCENRDSRVRCVTLVSVVVRTDLWYKCSIGCTPSFLESHASCYGLRERGCQNWCPHVRAHGYSNNCYSLPSLTSLSAIGAVQRRRRFVVAIAVGGIPSRDRSCYVNFSCILLRSFSES